MVRGGGLMKIIEKNNRIIEEFEKANKEGKRIFIGSITNSM